MMVFRALSAAKIQVTYDSVLRLNASCAAADGRLTGCESSPSYRISCESIYAITIFQTVASDILSDQITLQFTRR